MQDREVTARMVECEGHQHQGKCCSVCSEIDVESIKRCLKLQVLAVSVNSIGSSNSCTGPAASSGGPCQRAQNRRQSHSNIYKSRTGADSQRHKAQRSACCILQQGAFRGSFQLPLLQNTLLALYGRPQRAHADLHGLDSCDMVVEMVSRACCELENAQAYVSACLTGGCPVSLSIATSAG